MIKISEAILEISKTPFFQFGLSNKLINLSKLAKFIHPMVEARTKKEVSTQAILMGLSRLQRGLTRTSSHPKNLQAESIMVDSNLCTITFSKNPELHSKINLLYNHIQKAQGYLTITEGMNEITLITEEQFVDSAKKIIGLRPKNISHKIASVGIKFNEKYNKIPGMLYTIIQQIALQNINIVEITSTYTEFILYVPFKDARLTADTLFNCLSA